MSKGPGNRRTHVIVGLPYQVGNPEIQFQSDPLESSTFARSALRLCPLRAVPKRLPRPLKVPEKPLQKRTGVSADFCLESCYFYRARRHFELRQPERQMTRATT